MKVVKMALLLFLPPSSPEVPSSSERPLQLKCVLSNSGLSSGMEVFLVLVFISRPPLGFQHPPVRVPGAPTSTAN
jgi:hypothetical protein